MTIRENLENTFFKWLLGRMQSSIKNSDISVNFAIQGGPVLNVNKSPIHSQLKNKLICIMSFS